MKIFMAEDDRISRKIISTYLKNWGYEVVLVEDGLAAEEFVKSGETFQIAILDWMMPGRDGLDICQMIKEDEDRGFVYVMMLTAITDKEDISAALDVGADDYITKPFSAEELGSRLRAGERIVRLESGLQEKITALIEVRSHVKELQKFLPICAWCKKIRDDSDYWNSLEEYLRKNSDIEISHGICPECLKKIHRKKLTTAK